MKNFLKKKPVFITLVSVAVVLLVFYIAMLARPISYGMTYKATEEGVTTKITFDSKQIKNEISEDDGSTVSYKLYFVEKDGEFMILPGTTKDSYKDDVKEAKENWGTYQSAEQTIKINAFSFKVDDVKYTCSGAIVFAVVMGLVEATVIAFAVTSTVLFVKKK